MAGLFSEASTGPALEELGASIGKLGMTIYGKLDEAEATSEYQSGQLRLEKMMNQFDQSLSQDPEYDTWGDKNTKAMSDSWDAATKSVKNPKAFNALNEWWVGQKVSRDKAINNRIIGARIAKLSGALHTNIDETMTSDASVDQKKARIEGLGQAAVATNVADPGAWEDERARLFKTLDKNDLQSKGLAVMNQQGEEAGTLWMLDPKNSQNLTEQEREQIATSAASSHKLIETIQDKKARTSNLQIKGTFIDRIFAGDLPPTDEIAKADWKSSAGVDSVMDREELYKLQQAKVKELSNGDLWDEWQNSPEKTQDKADELMRELTGRKHTTGQMSGLRNFMKVDKTKPDITAPVLSKWGNLGEEGRTTEAKDSIFNKFTEDNPNASSAQIIRVLSLKTTPIQGNPEEDAARVANDKFVEDFQGMVLTGDMPATQAEAYSMIDQKKWANVGKVTEKNWVNQSKSIVDAYYRERAIRARKQTAAEKDDQLWKYAKPFIEGTAKGSDDDIDKVMSAVVKLHGTNGIDIDTIARFKNRIVSMSKLTEDERAELKSLAVMPGDPTEVRSASAKAYADMSVWIKKNPEEASRPGAIKSRAEAMKEAELSPIINKGLESLSTGEKWFGSRIWSDVFPGGKNEMLQMGKLMMNGDVEIAAQSGSLDSISFLKALNDSALASLKDVTGMKGDPLVKKNKNGDIQPTSKSEFETIGGVPRMGQYPLSEMVSPDKSTYYQLWMNDHSELLWYAIPKASYAANRDDWKLLK